MFAKFSKIFFGWDRFSKIILMIGIFLFVINYTWILGAILIIYSIWRVKSAKLQGRNNGKFVFENMKSNFHYDIRNFNKNIKFNNFKKHRFIEKLREKRNFIIISCPKCTQKLRLPRGKGKIIVTCSKCCSEFRLRT
jgi:hypothetical protein